jgi:menaquinol-cytochrome c reductase iron-sulfur subunit
MSDETKQPEHPAESSDVPEKTSHPEAPPATADEIARRQLLGRMSVGVGVLCGGAISVPGVGFVVAPLLQGESKHEWKPVFLPPKEGEEMDPKRSLKLDDIEIGKTVLVVFTDASPLAWAGVTSHTAAWLRRVSEKEFLAFSINCAHLGCPVRWREEARLFMCPCHGGVYYEDGRVAAGPPPHPLTRYPVQVDRGELQIMTEPIPLD